MLIAVLSPCLLEVRNKEEWSHYFQLADLINNLYLYTNLKFQYYRKAPYDGYKMEIPTYQNLHLNNLVAVNIFSTIQKMLMKDYIDLDSFDPVILPETFLVNDDKFSEAFRSYLNYLHGKDAILFIGEDNFHVSRPIKLYLNKSFEINTSTYVTIELTKVLLPYLKDVENYDLIFPREEFSSKYNEYVLKETQQKNMSQTEKIALFEKVGTIVATYNLYNKNHRLSKLNSTKNKIRIVYEKNIGKKYYLSLDVESGGFEVFDQKFTHLGQFNFSCKQVKRPKSLNHILKH